MEMMSEREELSFKIDNKTIIRLLGNQNFSNKNTAILELIKNAYDASANNLEIIFDKDKITFIDDGEGMSEETIRHYWMVVGKSSKSEQYAVENHGKSRILTGSMGVGRFALSRLGDEVVVYSKKKKFPSVEWSTDWNNNFLDSPVQDAGQRTKITISKLKDSWNKDDFEKLTTYLSKVCRQNDMNITVCYHKSNEEIVKTIKNYYPEPELGINCLEIIYIRYNSENMVLTCEIKSDEFKEEAQDLCTLNIHQYNPKIEIFNEMLKEYKGRETELEKYLHGIGDFEATLCFAMNPTSRDVERFLYKYPDFKKNHEGVVLYRNAFSINSVDGSTDWLEFGKRSRSSPAAATHATGKWRVRENQIFGWINIDRNANKNIKELANRQDIEKDDFFILFKNIIILGISEFERYRQGLIRQINKKNENLESATVKNQSLLDNFIENKINLKTLSNEDSDKIVATIRAIKANNEDYIQKIKDMEKAHGYETRLLNLLATIGMKAASIGHELGNCRNRIEGASYLIENVLKKEKMWDTLCEDRLRHIFSTDVPGMLQALRNDVKPIIKFAETMSRNIKKSSFESEQNPIKPSLCEVVKQWKSDYDYVEIVLDCNEDLSFYHSYDVIKTIFDNLILNSIQQAEFSRNVLIKIKCVLEDDAIIFDYSDNGPGLPQVYRMNPLRILEPHETSRKDGHGLGMWIVNTTIRATGGKIQSIYPGNGFKIEFRLGSNYDNRTY